MIIQVNQFCGVGAVNLLFTLGKSLKLKDVLFVPKIEKNLVSGACLNCEGYKQVIESDRYILSRFGIFLVLDIFVIGCLV